MTQQMFVDSLVPVDSHVPTSGESQDISHVVASIFKGTYTNDVIGKHTVSNILKTKAGQSSYSDKCAEELQEAHSDYQLCIKKADMLENHIIQARAEATAKERRAFEKIRENIGDFSDYQGAFTVQSAFSWCVDEDLLRRNNLITPRDYLTTQTPQLQALTAAWELQNDEFSLISKKIVLKMNEQDDSHLQTMKGTLRVKPKMMAERSKKNQEDVMEELQKFKVRQNFLRNPRFRPPTECQSGTSPIRAKVMKKCARKDFEDQSCSMKNRPFILFQGGFRSTDAPAPVFQAKPSVIMFTEYVVGHVYESTLELTNVTTTSCHVRVIPPTTPYFSIDLGRFPGEGGVVAPGMSCKYTVHFTPDTLGNYKDFVEVKNQTEELLIVPIEALRPPPVLTLPRVLDCGSCLVGGVKFVEFHCQNVGLSPGTFYIALKNQWQDTNLRSISRFSEQPPFAVRPSLFILEPGESTVVEVVFFPTAAERSSQTFTIVCNNCQVKDISIEGEGHFAKLELVSVSGETKPLKVGEVHDLTAEHFVRFSSCNPHSVQQKTLVIRNKIHIKLPFYWQIMKPNLHPLLPGRPPEPSYIHFHQATNDVFHISPTSGVLAPCQDQEFILTFNPKELEEYHSVCHLVLVDVPQLLPEPSESSCLQLIQTEYKVRDVVNMEIEVKGPTEPYQILLEPYAVVVPGEVLMCTPIHRQFKMWNHSKTFILFQWEKLENSGHIMEVAPSAGRIEENECFDFDLVLTGWKPGKVETMLVCNVQHHNEPVILAVEVSFKGPTVTLNVPSVDFGLVRLGEQTQTTLLLTSSTNLESSWLLEDKFHEIQDQQDPQILVEPCKGVLPPFASCNVEMVFRPRFCQQFETELELTVKGGTGCHVWVRADVQSPQVCLLNSKLVFSEFYIGVPTKGSVTLFNQTLLPSDFSWMAELQGKQAPLCAASFDPPSGTLGPNESTEITVTFTSHTDLELTEVAAVCDVQGMNLPLILAILTFQPKNLCVSYSLPGGSSLQHDSNPSSLLLDFGDVTLNRAVTKQLLITNQTAIPAPFFIEAEYFTCHVLMPNKSEKRFAYIKKPLYALQTNKVEAKAQKEFVSNLLADGKGGIFHVLPGSGILRPFETQTLDVTAYSEMWGEYKDYLICKVGGLKPVRVLMKMTVKGCPLYFQMTGPREEDQFQGPNICFGTHVSGGETVSRLLRVNNPTMFDIRVDWETYNLDQNDHKLVDVLVSYGEQFPLKDADGNEVFSEALRLFNKTEWERTHTPVSVGPCSSLQSVTDADEEELATEDACKEKEATLYLPPAKKNLISVRIKPHIGNLSHYPYCITPRQLVIPAKSSGNIHISFTPLTLSASDGDAKCPGLALGFMSLDSQIAVCVPNKVRREHGLDLEPVRVNLQAAVKPAVLLVQMDEDEGVLEFNASAGDLLRAKSDKKLEAHNFDVTRTFQLINTAEMPLHFKLGTQLPFSVVKPQAGDGLALQPQHSMQVKLAFRCSLPLLDHMDQTEEGISPGVRLIQTECGQKKLRFQQNLLIHFSNDSLQTVPLCAYLDLPTLSLSADSLSFGFCYIGQTQTRDINLYSHGAHTHWTTLTNSNEKDPRVFRVTPDFGLLRSKQPHGTTCSQCLQISFTPSENREFKAVVVFQSPLVKTPVTLQLQGTGSFDEADRPQNTSP